jgi:PAS domain S-box-containing protein
MRRPQKQFRTKTKWKWPVIGLAILIVCAAAWQFVLPRWRVDPSDRVYRIGYGEDMPYHFRGADGKAAGLAVDMVREAARRRGIRLEWHTSGSPGIPSLQSGETDLWVLMTIRPERRNVIHLTEPYLVTDTTILVPDEGRPKSLAELRTARISILDFDTHRRNLKLVLPEATAVGTASTADAILAVNEGRADAAYLDQFTATGALLTGISRRPLQLLATGLPRGLMGLGSTFEAGPVADAIREEIRTLAQDGTLSALGQSWGFFTSLSVDAISNFERERQQNQLLWVGVGGLLAVILLVGVLANRLRLSEARWELALRGSMDGIWDYEPLTGRVYLSDRWKEMLGYAPEELANAEDTWVELLHPEDSERAQQTVKDHLEGRSAMLSAEYRMRTKSGGYRWIHSRGKALRNAEGKAVRMAGSHTDITERKATEEALRTAMAKAEAANRAKSEFLANMSHEIRTPMNAILGMAGLAQRADSSGEREECLEQMTKSAESLLELLTQILDLSRVEAGRLELESVPFSVEDCMGTLITTFSVVARQKRLDFRVKCDPDIPGLVLGDPLRVRQILYNLTGNALKFTESGSVTVTSRLRRREEDHIVLEFSVQDTGIGIPAEKLELIFGAFHQADGSSTRQYGGSGLGLTICRNLAEAMGGRIEVESREGIGSRFSFTARFGTDTGSAAAGADNHPAEDAATEASGLRILVAEDNAVNQKLMERLLVKEGQSPVVAGDGQQALELAGREEFDLILMDLHMPVLDGLKATQRIRERERGRQRRVAIWAVTAAAAASDRKACEEAGMDGFLTKPVHLAKLREILRRVSKERTQG